MDEIPEVLHLDAPPLVPDDWDIQSIEKFDDGFTNPHIIIRYDNKIRLSILSGDVDFSREYKKQEPIVLQDKGISVYGNDRQSVYVIRVDGLYYAFLFPKESRREVEDAVVRLLGRSRI